MFWEAVGQVLLVLFLFLIVLPAGIAGLIRFIVYRDIGV